MLRISIVTSVLNGIRTAVSFLVISDTVKVSYDMIYSYTLRFPLLLLVTL